MSFLTTETAHECSQWTFSCLLGEEKEIQIQDQTVLDQVI